MRFPSNSQILEKGKQWLTAHKPFVLFKYPEQSTIQAVFQNDREKKLFYSLDQRGFVFAPFQGAKDQHILIYGDLLKESWDLPPNTSSNSTAVSLSTKYRDHHIQRVAAAKEAIRKGDLQKVVLSRSITVKTSKRFLDIFVGLVQKYNSAFCYGWYHPSVGMWLGATPERLVAFSVDTLKTTALAGTLPYVPKSTPQWTAKEIEEQQMVTDYIMRCLEDKANSVNTTLAQSIRAGNVWHLRSEITAKLPFEELMNVVKAVHPTPAICGLPLKAALHFINEQEQYDREFYCGYMGPINIVAQRTVDFFVNLRCLKYLDNKANIYVGGGITGESDPEMEWEETQHKSKTILAVL
ncbi:MAG: chorismate-binding protein [Bacteroidota bacterium]